MTCRKVRRLLPLAAGDDLGAGKARAVRAHVEACPACRRELEGYRSALDRFRAAARQEGVPDWSEGEWRALMARAAGGGTEREAGPRPRGLGWRIAGPRWASASALGLVAGLAVLWVLFRGPAAGPWGTRAAAGLAAGARPDRGQDVVAMTMVSQETGLQIVWFLDRNFDYQGEQE